MGLAVAVSGPVACRAPAPVGGQPPDLLCASPAAGTRRSYEKNPTSGRSVWVDVKADTLGQSLFLDWSARDATAAQAATASDREATAFWPTAFCFSMVDDAVLFLAGRNSADQPVLERWTIGSYVIGQATSVGITRTTFAAPTVTRESIAIDPTVGQVCSITTNPWTLPAPNEEIWVFEYPSKDVFGIHPATGAKTLRVDHAALGPYFTIDMKEHSVYGATCCFFRRPWYVESSAWLASVKNHPDLDVDRYVVYDSNKDGTADGTFLIATATFASHPLYGTGQWLKR